MGQSGSHFFASAIGLAKPLRLCAKNERFAPARRAFRAENLHASPQKEGSRASFSLRETSDFKALPRIFLPTSGAITSIAAGSGGELSIKLRVRARPAAPAQFGEAAELA
jgi:hypothetical protein